MEPADVAAVAELVAAVEAEDGHAPLGEHQWLDLVEGGREGFAGFLVRAPGEANLAAYAHLSRGPSSWAIELAVHPKHRADDTEGEGGLALALLRAALREVAAQGGGHVHWWVPKPDGRVERLAAAAGLRRGRDLCQMRAPLPVSHEPLAIPVRPFRPGEDEEAWLVVNNRAFAGHPEQGTWTLETLRARERQPWFDPQGFLLHEVDGRLAAFCWTKVHAGSPTALGEIYVVAVDPDFQGQGLGRALVLAGLDHLARRGLATAMLYVDRANRPARSLYESLGFVDHHLDRAYTADVAPA